LTVAEQILTLRQAATILQGGEALQRAAQDVHADRVERIFDKGSVSRGYSTTPIWIANKEMRGGQNKGKSGNALNTSYFQGGYKQYKGVIGFDNSKVNFRNTNDLQSDFANSRINTGTGAPNSGQVIKVNNLLYVEELRSSENVEKLKGNEKRFGNFTAFTNAEREKFNTILKFELIATLNGERK
jgi:hypothetical protein